MDASHDTHYSPNLPAGVVTPLLTREAVNLLMNCVTSKETELWHSLGDAWLVPRLVNSFQLYIQSERLTFWLYISYFVTRIVNVNREQWKGSVPPYHPIFMDGWSPDYPVNDNRGSTPSEQIPLTPEKRRPDEPRSHREVR